MASPKKYHHLVGRVPLSPLSEPEVYWSYHYSLCFAGAVGIQCGLYNDYMDLYGMDIQSAAQEIHLSD